MAITAGFELANLGSIPSTPTSFVSVSKRMSRYAIFFEGVV